jgi:hypothetical protein
MTIQQAPYLREQRQFPNEDVRALANQMDHAYIDIASKVNARTIGLYAVNFPIATGEQWFLEGQPRRQQTLRQLYTFAGTGSISHGINFDTVFLVSQRSYGTFTDDTDWYGAIYASSVAIAGQVSFYVTATNIVILAGAGAPTIVSGVIDLEWLSQF